MAISNSKIFLLVLVSFILGIFLGPFFNYNKTVFFFLFSTLFLLAFLWRKERLILALALSFLFLFLGIFRYQATLPQNNLRHIQYYNGQNIKLTGLVNSEPDKRLNKTNLTLSQLLLEGQRIDGKILVQTTLFPEYHYGDELEISGQLEEPAIFEDFSYKEYLLPKGIYSVIYWPKIKLLSQNKGSLASKGNFIYRHLFSFKERFTETLGKILSEPYSSLLTGLLYGARSKIPQSLMDSFNKTATIHIIAISGFNITIIVLALSRFLDLFLVPKKLVLILVGIIIFFFCAIVGFSASVVRAAIMGMMVLFGKVIGRKGDLGLILTFTATLMILQNPLILRYDLSFQLSFLSTLGLVYLSSKTINFFSFLPKIFSEPLGLTLAAYTMSLPLILYQFGRLSLVALPANALILEIIPPLMLIGFLSGLFGLIFLPLGEILGFFAWAFLSYIIWTAQVLGNLPFSSYTLGKFSFYLFIPYYLILFLIISKKKIASYVEKISLFYKKASL